jgi:hypothetical protein
MTTNTISSIELHHTNFDVAPIPGIILEMMMPWQLVCRKPSLRLLFIGLALQRMLRLMTKAQRAQTTINPLY